MIYYTADTHFGHENIIKLCNRPFKNVEEMNSVLIDNWNKKVTGHDTVYIIGDMFNKCKNAEQILKQLKGKKHLIIGNHDGSWLTKFDATPYFESIALMKEISANNHGITMCHYPLLTWHHEKKTYMIHGHIHNNTSGDYWPLIRKRERVLNADVEINNYEPVTFEELYENNIKFKEMNGGDTCGKY